jgi:endoglucanase
MRRLLLTLFFLILILKFSEGQQPNAFEINQNLGRGINMGNAFEAPSEEAWGNPWQPEYFELIASLGFDHVRLPIRWEPEERSLAEPPYTISETFLERIKTVVDKALGQNLMIIINMHHHEELYANPEGQKERFLSQWSQIAEYFKDYPQELLFEILNEPHGELSPGLGNTYIADALETIRTTNPNRAVLMGTANYGGLSGVPDLQLPDDDNLILTVHYYNPFQFTHQGADWVGEGSENWLGTQWYDTEAERETIIGEFEQLIGFSGAHNIPVHIGEFGAFSEADMDSRARWTTFLARWFEEQGFSWAYWEFSAGFGIYNPTTEEYHEPLVDALLHNSMPEPTPVEYIGVYDTDFSENTDGWYFNTQEGAVGNIVQQNQLLVVNVETAGNESWHAQVVKEGISLEEGEMYRLSFLAGAGFGMSVPVYVGMASAPWTSFTFTMSEPSDVNCRIVLDMGLLSGTVELDEVKLEQVSIDLALNSPASIGVNVFPNPVKNDLFFVSERLVETVEILDLSGRMMFQENFLSAEGSVNTSTLSSGFYFVIVSLQNGQQTLKKIFVE